MFYCIMEQEDAIQLRVTGVKSIVTVALNIVYDNVIINVVLLQRNL